LTIANQSVTEGGAFGFTETLSNDVESGVQLNFATSNGTAGDGSGSSDSDYTENHGTLTFDGTAGETQTITVQTTTDTKVEANETLSVTLSSVAPQGAGVSSTNFTPPPSPSTLFPYTTLFRSLTIANQSVTEGG